MIKNVFKIYKSDIKKISRNWAAIVILTGLSILPSLYAWVNIAASWDPYGNTSGIKVGIVNNDIGGTIRDNDVHVGDEVVDSLKENDKLGWKFFDSKEDGIKAAENGDVYATIIIPEEFSKDLCTVLDKEPRKPKLQYYVNEKINAIAPKMTDSGASTIQKQITTSFTETAVNKVFEVFNKAGVELDKHYVDIEKFKDEIIKVDEKFPELYDKMDDLIADANDGIVRLDNKDPQIKEFQDILERTTGYMDDINKDLLDANERIIENTPDLRENLSLMQSIFSNVSKETESLGDFTVNKKPEVIAQLDNATQDVRNLHTKLKEVSKKVQNTGQGTSTELNRLNNEMSDILDEDERLLINLKSNLWTAQGTLTSSLNNLSNVTDKLASKMSEINNVVDKTFTGTDSVLANLETLFKKIENIISILKGNTDTSTLQNAITDATTTINSLNSSMQGNSLYASAVSSNEQLKDILSTLQSSSLDQASINQAIKDLRSSNIALSTVIAGIRSNLNTQKASIDSLLSETQASIRQVSTACTNVGAIATSSTRDVSDKVDSTLKRMSQMENVLTNTMDDLSKKSIDNSSDVKRNIDALLPKVKKLESKISELRDNINNKDEAEKILYDISELSANMDSSIEKILIRLDENVLPKLERYLTNSASYILDVRRSVNNLNGDFDSLRDLLNRIKNRGEITVTDLQKIRDKMPETQDKVHEAANKIRELEETINLRELINIFNNDKDTESDFFGTPVNLDKHELFPMPNYGASMTPFYTTLCLWVGALLLTALLSTKALNVDFEVKPREEFFGKFLLFLTFALAQGFIATVGDMVVLGVEVKEKGLLIFIGLLCSLVFMMIVYSFVSLFGNVGKAIAVVLLVVQIGGSGGTFPIEVTPKFFQIIHAALPFTYGIGAMREAVAGVVYSALVKDVVVLLLYFVLFAVIGLTLKKPINKMLDKVNHKLEQADVMGH
jgi:putative membrane protein